MRRFFLVLLCLPVLLSGCVVHEFRDSIPGRYPVTIQGVIEGLRSGVPESQLISDIRTQGVLRHPGADDIVAMKQAGASDWMIREMIHADVTEFRPAEERRTVYYDSRPAESAVALGFGVLAGWALFGHHHHHRSYHYRRGR